MVRKYVLGKYFETEAVVKAVEETRERFPF